MPEARTHPYYEHVILIQCTIGVWSQEDLNHILGRYGVFIVERTGTDIDDALAALTPWRQNIWVIQQLIQNDVSSTKIRLFLKREMSVRYLVPAPVINVRLKETTWYAFWLMR